MFISIFRHFKPANCTRNKQDEVGNKFNTLSQFWGPQYTTCLNNRNINDSIINLYINLHNNVSVQYKYFDELEPHRIGGNRERRVVNNFSFSIAKINVFDCQNRYNGNRKRLI